MRQATYAELVSALEQAMAEAGWHGRCDAFRTGNGSRRKMPGGGTLVRHVYVTDDDILAEVYVYAAGCDDAPACVLRTMGGTCTYAWHALQGRLREVGATAEMMASTFTVQQVEAMLCAALAAQDACREMARKADRLSEQVEELERDELWAQLHDLSSVDYAYRTGQHVRF
jgi:hypothetical protein